MLSANVPTRDVRFEQSLTVTTTIVIGYIRVSTKNTGQDSSIETQRARLEAHGCTEFFVDRKSGGTFDRPGWFEFEQCVEQLLHQGQNTITVCVTTHERIGRGAEVPAMIQRLESMGVSFHSLDDGPISSATPESELLLGMRSLLSGYERSRTRYRILSNKDWARSSGLHIGGKPPLGYRVGDDGHLAIDPDTAPIVRELVRLYINEPSMGTQQLARWLKTTHGIVRSLKGVSGLLRSPTLRGHTLYRQVRGQSGHVFKANTHDALITPAEARQIDRLLDERKPTIQRGKPVLACSGLVFCAACRVRLRLLEQPRVDGSIYRVYRCPGHRPHQSCPDSGVVRYETVEPMILDAIARYADDIARAALEPDEPIDDPRIAEIEAQIAAYQQLHDQRPMMETASVIARLRSEVEQMRSHKGAASVVDQQQLQAMAQAMAQPGYWTGLDDQQRNQIYRDLGVRCWRVGRSIERVELGCY